MNSVRWMLQQCGKRDGMARDLMSHTCQLVVPVGQDGAWTMVQSRPKLAEGRLLLQVIMNTSSSGRSPWILFLRRVSESKYFKSSMETTSQMY